MAGPAAARIVSAMYKHPDDDLIISTRTAPKAPSVAALMPIMAVVLIAFLVIGIRLCCRFTSIKSSVSAHSLLAS